MIGGGVVFFGNGFKIINYNCYSDDENMDKNDVNNNNNSNSNIYGNNDNDKNNNINGILNYYTGSY